MRVSVDAWAGARATALSAVRSPDGLRSSPPPQREARANVGRRRRMEGNTRPGIIGGSAGDGVRSPEPDGSWPGAAAG